MIKWDGHTHTKFCYHGNPAPSECYLDRAIALGFERYSITEHPPLPSGWVSDPSLFKELAMPEPELPAYLSYAAGMKQKYADKLDIVIGLELDFLPGRLDYTEQMLDRFGSQLEDIVYSVHYLPGLDGNRCIDFTADDFREGLLSFYGTMEAVVEAYYDQVEAAIEHARHFPVRTRIGHIQLIEKFRLVLPPVDEQQMMHRLTALIPKLKSAGVGLDVNMAGLSVATCGRMYVPDWFLAACMREGIPCVYGSDAHKPDHVGRGWDRYESLLRSLMD